MTQFEKALYRTHTLEEALTLQPCLADHVSSCFIDSIRYAFIEKKFGIDSCKAFMLKLLIDRDKKEAFERALNKNPISEMVAMSVCSGS